MASVRLSLDRASAEADLVSVELVTKEKDNSSETSQKGGQGHEALLLLIQSHEDCVKDTVVNIERRNRTDQQDSCMLRRSVVGGLDNEPRAFLQPTATHKATLSKTLLIQPQRSPEDPVCRPCCPGLKCALGARAGGAGCLFLSDDEAL
ncbi:hypothetical protein EYF80_023383 [Liparis tanakae]|uniref:Uncharacterized protein n=1 Tax=Liparis tanakae TaxID=230148 RepID=A0A4Z2HN16_9TELE|nr:hypothetical protein EYF80_023383 [Liparis tanakae]